MAQETVEMYTARREREIFEERLITAKIQKERNYAVLRAKFSRFGMTEPMPRTIEEIAVITATELRVLGADTQSNNAKVDDGAVLKSEQSDTVITSKEPLIRENLPVTKGMSNADISQRSGDDEPCVTAVLNYLDKCVTKPEREIVNSLRGTHPFKGYVGNKSSLIKQTLSNMVSQGLLCSTLDDGKASYSLTV